MDVTKAEDEGQERLAATALVGAVQSFIVGVTAGSSGGRFSVRRGLTAGLAGIVLGASLGAASSYGLTPLYLMSGVFFRWHTSKGRFPKSPARDWQRTSFYVYAWRSGS